MNTSRVLGLQLLRNMWEELLIDGIGQERGEGSQSSAQSEENIKQSVERMQGIVQSILSLQPASVESDVPVGRVVNELKESGHHSIQSVSLNGC